MSLVRNMLKNGAVIVSHPASKELDAKVIPTLNNGESLEVKYEGSVYTFTMNTEYAGKNASYRKALDLSYITKVVDHTGEPNVFGLEEVPGLRTQDFPAREHVVLASNAVLFLEDSLASVNTDISKRLLAERIRIKLSRMRTTPKLTDAEVGELLASGFNLLFKC